MATNTHTDHARSSVSTCAARRRTLAALSHTHTLTQRHTRTHAHIAHKPHYRLNRNVKIIIMFSSLHYLFDNSIAKHAHLHSYTDANGHNSLYRLFLIRRFVDTSCGMKYMEKKKKYMRCDNNPSSTTNGIFANEMKWKPNVNGGKKKLNQIFMAIKWNRNESMAGQYLPWIFEFDKCKRRSASILQINKSHFAKFME